MIPYHSTHIAGVGRGQEKLKRLTLLCDNEMDFQAIKEPPFYRLFFAPYFSSVEPVATDTIFVVCNNQKTDNVIDRAFIKIHLRLSEPREQGQEQFSDAMQTAIEMGIGLNVRPATLIL